MDLHREPTKTGAQAKRWVSAGNTFGGRVPEKQAPIRPASSAASLDLDAGVIDPLDAAGDSSAAGIELDSLVKKFGDHVVIDDVSMYVAPGEVTAIIGPSGAGKSTLLRCINLLERPDSGVMHVAGVRIDASTNVNAKSLAQMRRKVGMVFQSFNLFPHLSVLRNVTLPQERVLGRSKTAARQNAMRLLDRVGLADKAKQYPTKCSGGQQQRIAIARALALDPEIMLFDGPTSSLDPKLGLGCSRSCESSQTRG